VLVADAQKVKGLAPLACKTDRIDARVLATLSERDLVPAVWLLDPAIRRERELARFRLHLVRHRTTLKSRIHATLITFGHPCPVSDLFGLAWPRAARPSGHPRPVAAHRRRQPGPYRRSRAADRAAHRRAQPPRRRSPLHLAVGHGTGVRVDQPVHRRLGDRRHRTLRLPGQALRLHRPVPTSHPAGQHRPTRPDLKARAALPVLARRHATARAALALLTTRHSPGGACTPRAKRKRRSPRRRASLQAKAAAPHGKCGDV
jgi:transposase